MSQYTSTIRTSYFRVRNTRAFEIFCERFGLSVIKKPSPGAPGLHGFSVTGSEHSLMTSFYEEKTGEDVEADIFLNDLSKQLSPGWTTIIMETGGDDTIVLKGRAIALNDEGETRTIDLRDIYEAAKELGGTSTACED